ncbi:lysophospholipid acyltransferase family protein [Paenibacillus ferrarius]|uniref:lysophospholipid acyltransferase family protein n=1 Tax=Paenibacillus ferrarius TaxID=1469647 RepID=UPI003D26D11C
MYEWIAKLTAGEGQGGLWQKVLTLLPVRIVFRLCSMLAYFAMFKARKGILAQISCNMADLLGPMSTAQLQLLTRQYVCNAMFTLFEIIFLSKRLPPLADKLFQVDGEAHLEEALKQANGKGFIVYTPHVGNFFYYYWYLTRKYDCLTVASAGSPELRPMYLQFQAMGCQGLDYDSMPPLELYRTLKKHVNRGGVVFLLGDFWRPSFPVSRFFGRMTRTPEGAAMLALEHQVPIVPMHGYRGRDGKHRLVFHAPLLYCHGNPLNGRQARADVNVELNRFMETVIRAHPASWFYWFNAHERWERDADARDVGDSKLVESAVS